MSSVYDSDVDKLSCEGLDDKAMYSSFNLDSEQLLSTLSCKGNCSCQVQEQK